MNELSELCVIITISQGQVSWLILAFVILLLGRMEKMTCLAGLAPIRFAILAKGDGASQTERPSQPRALEILDAISPGGPPLFAMHRHTQELWALLERYIVKNTPIFLRKSENFFQKSIDKPQVPCYNNWAL